eukprot:FR734720.1.p1 GENE.FR734720.1~~FR734720.1.p1  ORF type:complete len:152 (+),score=10.97 FR734720.1:52-456(+)
MVFFIDGVAWYEVDKCRWWTGHAGAADSAPFDQKFYLILNIAVGGVYTGDPSQNTEWPQDMRVDYVRVYQNRHGPSVNCSRAPTPAPTTPAPTVGHSSSPTNPSEDGPKSAATKARVWFGWVSLVVLGVCVLVR